MHVGNGTYKWEPGRVIAFDDSIIHSVEHHGQLNRTVLIVDILHPAHPNFERRLRDTTTADELDSIRRRREHWKDFFQADGSKGRWKSPQTKLEVATTDPVEEAPRQTAGLEETAGVARAPTVVAMDVAAVADAHATTAAKKAKFKKLAAARKEVAAAKRKQASTQQGRPERLVANIEHLQLVANNAEAFQAFGGATYWRRRIFDELHVHPTAPQRRDETSTTPEVETSPGAPKVEDPVKTTTSPEAGASSAKRMPSVSDTAEKRAEAKKRAANRKGTTQTKRKRLVSPLTGSATEI